MGRIVADVRRARVRQRAGPVAASAAYRAPSAGLLPAHRRSRRRDARARAERRGLPRARVLGRDVRFPVPQRQASRGRARLADVSLPPDRGGTGGGPGGRGAMFPWQSGSEGTEESQRVHLNPMSGRWEPDLSHNRRHVNAAIFFNIWNYFQATRDYAFLESYGAEMMLDIARFWASVAHFNPTRERYEIHGVMGPDEFHEKYPGAQQGGLRNNAYTNVMVAWLCDIAARVPSLLSASGAEGLRARLSISGDELELWQDLSRRMLVPFNEDGIISQFEGWSDLEELDWDAYRAKYENIQRLDRILRAEGDEPKRYKIATQAETVS